MGALASFEAAAKGFENGLLLKDSLNRVESDEHPASQTPTNAVRATRAPECLTSNAAKFLIGFNSLERNPTCAQFEPIRLREGLR